MLTRPGYLVMALALSLLFLGCSSGSSNSEELDLPPDALHPPTALDTAAEPGLAIAYTVMLESGVTGALQTIFGGGFANNQAIRPFADVTGDLRFQPAAVDEEFAVTRDLNGDGIDDVHLAVTNFEEVAEDRLSAQGTGSMIVEVLNDIPGADTAGRQWVMQSGSVIRIQTEVQVHDYGSETRNAWYQATTTFDNVEFYWNDGVRSGTVQTTFEQIIRMDVTNEELIDTRSIDGSSSVEMDGGTHTYDIEGTIGRRFVPSSEGAISFTQFEAYLDRTYYIFSPYYEVPQPVTDAFFITAQDIRYGSFTIDEMVELGDEVGSVAQ